VRGDKRPIGVQRAEAEENDRPYNQTREKALNLRSATLPEPAAPTAAASKKTQFYIGDRRQRKSAGPTQPRSSAVKRKADGAMDGGQLARRRGGAADPARANARDAAQLASKKLDSPPAAKNSKANRPPTLKKPAPPLKKKSDAPPTRVKRAGKNTKSARMRSATVRAA
jgi:hypothetical protein